MSGKTEVKYEDNSSKVLQEAKEKKKQILYAWGLKLQSLIVKRITVQKQVDTGRLRSSITFSTHDKQGASIAKSNASKSTDYINGEADENTLVIGSNVEYAKKVEFTSKKGSYMRSTILEARDELVNILKQIWQK